MKELQVVSVDVVSFEEVFLDLFLFGELVRFDFVSEGFWTFQSDWKSADKSRGESWNHYLFFLKLKT